MSNLNNGHFQISDSGTVRWIDYGELGGGAFLIIAVAIFTTVFSKVGEYILNNKWVIAIAIGVAVLLRTVIIDRGVKPHKRVFFIVADIVKTVGIYAILLVFLDWVLCSHWLDKVVFSILGVAIFGTIYYFVSKFLLFIRAADGATDGIGFYWILCIIIFVIGFAINANVERYWYGYDYKVFMNSATIVDYDDKRISGDIEVPAKVSTYKVTTIGKNDSYIGVFSAENIKSVTLPEGVTTIKRHAFSYSDSIKQINLPSTVSKIEDDAFYRNKNLKYINVSPDNKYFIFENGILYTKDKTRTVWTPYVEE